MQLNRIYKSIFTVLISALCTEVSAQVSISGTDINATLDISKSPNISFNDGLSVPRMTGDELRAKDNAYKAAQNATVVYVTKVATQSSTKTENVKRPNYYYYDGKLEKWMALNHPKFFYMPPIAFDTTVFIEKTINLYDLYYTEFNSPKKSSSGSFGKIPTVGRTDLDYYVTYYDTEVFSNISISETGEMKYTVKKNASEETFLNIVFVLK